MTNWYDNIVDDVVNAIEAVYAKKSYVEEIEEDIHTLIYGTGSD